MVCKQQNGRETMHKSLLAVVAAGTVSLAACATNPQTAQDVGTGAAVGAAGGAVAGAVLPGVSVAQGAVVGAAIGGLAGATWASRANNGVVDGYYYNGQYYPGTPAGYDPTLGRVATGAAIGGAVGAGVGAITGAGVIPGAVVGPRSAAWLERYGPTGIMTALSMAIITTANIMPVRLPRRRLLQFLRLRLRGLANVDKMELK